jgi:DNA-binding winged helix-turn-helix (wHTH) protein/Tol biopolymer transport system component
VLMQQEIVSDKGKLSLIRFGGFTLDLERHGLYRGEERIRLTPKPLETLIFLVENHGRTIEKQRLLDAVWKETFVTEDTLVHAIREIRRALEDDKEDPRFIQTVPRQGYRFIGEISTEPLIEELKISDEAPELPTIQVEKSDIHPSQKAESKLLSFKWILAALITLVISISLLRLIPVFWKEKVPVQPQKQPVLIQLTSEIDGAGKPAYSSEGSLLYISKGAIHLRLADGEASLQITDEINPSGDMPVFTADGSKVVFSLPRNGEDGSRSYDLYKVDCIGGPPTVFIKEASGAGFSPDGKWVAYTKNLSSRKALLISPLDNLEEYIEVKEHGFVPRWSPDGKWLAYTTSDPNADIGTIWIADFSITENGRLAIREQRELTSKAQQMYGLAWTQDSSEIIFAARGNGPMHLYKLSISDGSIQPLTVGGGDYVCPSVSPDGLSLIFWYGSPVHNLIVADHLEGRQERTVTQDEYHLWPRLSPSGERLVTVTRRPDYDEHLYMIDLKTMKRLRLSDHPARHPQWIDEENVLYLQDGPSGSTEVRLVNIATGVQLLLSRFLGEARWPALHPNKRLLAVVVRQPDGREEIVLRDLDKQRNDIKIAEGADYEGLRWLNDGSALSWSGTERSSGSESNGIWVVEPERGEPRRIVKDGYGPVWSTDGKSLYFSRIRDYTGLWRLDLEQKRETKIRDWKIHNFYDFDIVGGRLVFTESGGRGQIYSMSLEQ